MGKALSPPPRPEEGATQELPNDPTFVTASRRSTIAAVEINRDQQLRELADAAHGGDGEALERLCTELQRFVRGFFWNKFQDAELVDELTQETYLRMLKNFQHLRDTSRVRAFVAKVAFHVSQDHLRRKYRSREESLEPLLERGADPVDPTTSGQARVVNSAALESALAELPEKAQQILILRTEGLKYDEISERTGLSVSGVKMQVKRSMEKLRGSVFL